MDTRVGGRAKAVRAGSTAGAGARPAGTQALQRAGGIVRLVASRSRTGMRLAEVVRHSGLERPTAHRILRGLVAEGLLAQDERTRTYSLGPLVFELGLAAAPQFNLADICRPSLARIAGKTEDTVFLSVRSGHDSVCIDRMEGSFPIKALTLEVGARRPLGAGASGLAMLMPLPEESVREIVRANAVRLLGYYKLTVPALLEALARARRLGYAWNDAYLAVGAATVGLPVVNRYGQAFAAITVGAIIARMNERRRRQIVSILRAEIALIEKSIKGAIQPQGD
ncbi:MAG: IclR family transcriptional regulator [Burkholderiales bacterium]|nr:IclR family transcriptional regulator [Burkholderiales bacterium]